MLPGSSNSMQPGRRKLAESQYKHEFSAKGHLPVVATACKRHASEAINVEYDQVHDALIKQHQILQAKGSLFANFGQVIREYNERDMAYRLPADHLLSLIYYNVFRAFVRQHDCHLPVSHF